VEGRVMSYRILVYCDSAKHRNPVPVEEFEYGASMASKMSPSTRRRRERAHGPSPAGFWMIRYRTSRVISSSARAFTGDSPVPESRMGFHGQIFLRNAAGEWELQPPGAPIYSQTLGSLAGDRERYRLSCKFNTGDDDRLRCRANVPFKTKQSLDEVLDALRREEQTMVSLTELGAKLEEQSRSRRDSGLDEED